jgi:hypothetical protein
MKLQTVAIALVVSLGVLALAVPVMAAAADVERCSGLAGLWRDMARARDKGVSADVLRAKVDATKDTSADAKAKMDGAVTMIYGTPSSRPIRSPRRCLRAASGNNEEHFARFATRRPVTAAPSRPSFFRSLLGRVG